MLGVTVFPVQVEAELDQDHIGFIAIVNGRVKIVAPGGDAFPVGFVHPQINILPLNAAGHQKPDEIRII
tara:strand:+ start:676 stop:882 length:207 start_codon:yes stop_codon:yes gene_type:complete